MFVCSSKPQELTWEQINDCYADGHTNILMLIDLILSLPASTSDCERGFSKMKLTKTDQRNKLKSTTMSDLILIQLHSSSDIGDYEPSEAINCWNSPLRRPTLNDISMLSPCSEAEAQNIAVTETDHQIKTAGTASTASGVDDADSDYESNSDYSDYNMSESDLD